MIEVSITEKQCYCESAWLFVRRRRQKPDASQPSAPLGRLSSEFQPRRSLPSLKSICTGSSKLPLNVDVICVLSCGFLCLSKFPNQIVRSVRTTYYKGRIIKISNFWWPYYLATDYNEWYGCQQMHKWKSVPFLVGMLNLDWSGTTLLVCLFYITSISLWTRGVKIKTMYFVSLGSRTISNVFQALS